MSRKTVLAKVNISSMTGPQSHNMAYELFPFYISTLIAILRIRMANVHTTFSLNILTMKPKQTVKTQIRGRV